MTKSAKQAPGYAHPVYHAAIRSMQMARADDKQSLHPGAGTNPMVGIFWFVLDGTGLRYMLANGCDLAAAEAYGDCLTFVPGHYETWNKWRRRGASTAALRDIVRECEYEEWPRGRVVFDGIADRFILYADRRITAEGLVDEVVRYFGVPADKAVVRHDLHYQSTRAIKVAERRAPE
jgi:hypothetical protein